MITTVNIRSIVRPQCTREPTDYQCQQLEDGLEPLLREQLSIRAEQLVAQSAVGAIVIARWQRQHNVDPEEPRTAPPPSRY